MLTVGGIATVDHLASEPDNQVKGTAEAHAAAWVRVTSVGSSEFGGSESDWGHGAAENLIRKAVYEGAVNAYVSVSAGSAVETTEDVDLREIVDALPVYDQATELLEMAGYNEVTPDEGDILKAIVDVTVEQETGSKPVVTYQVTNATIEDITNNQG